MFTPLKNLETAFRHVKRFSLFFLCACVVLTGYAWHLAYSTVAQANRKIYVLANGKALEAFTADRSENIPVEARDHVKTFHQLFFSLDPDDKVIEEHMGKALYLADASGKKLYESLKENNYYAGIISGNISQEVTVDSIQVDTDHYPYHFRCLATQKIIRPSSLTTRSLVTEGFLRNVSRSDNNPHGFLIEKWVTVENKDIKTEKR